MAGGRILTIVFTDLVGSTELLSRLGDERFDELRRDHFALLRNAVGGRGGREVKTLGDGVMAVFPSAVDALAAAVEMQQAMEGRDAAIRVGLHVGEPISDEDDYFGSAVVIARRLCDSAAGGEIRASALVRALVGTRGGFSFRELGPVPLKGIADPVQALQVLWEERPPAGAPGRAAEPESQEPIPLPPALARDDATGFVGRASELERLRAAWQGAAAGERRLVLIAGEPGIGKTRLAARFAAELHAEGGAALYGRSEDESLVPYQPFVEGLRHYAAHVPLPELKAQASVEMAELERFLPDLRRRLPQLPLPRRGEPDTERFRLFEATAGLLATAAVGRPLMVVLDDLHWADRATILMLRHVARHESAAALLLLGTYRDVEIPADHPLEELAADLERDGRCERISLAGLAAAETGELLSALGAGGTVPDEARRLQERTAGNPFFIGEVVRHAGELASEGVPFETLGVPDSVKSLVGRRLAKLGEDARAVLTAAAAAGQRFELELLERALEAPALDVLDAAVEARLVGESVSTPGHYHFAHAVVRETLYGGVSAARRQRLHRLLAEALEGLCAGEPGARVMELAHHFLEGGGDDPRAIEYGVRAGNHAAAALAYEDAAGFYGRALAALEALAEPDRESMLEVLLRLAEVQRRAGERGRARVHFERAATLARELGDGEALAEAALGFGGPYVAAGLVDERLIELLEEALAVLGGEPAALRARVLARLSHALYFSPRREEGDALSAEALAITRRAGDTDALAHALYARRHALWGPDHLEERLELDAQLVAAATEAGNRELALHGRQFSLIDRLEGGNVEGARAEALEQERLAEELRQPFYERFPRLWTIVQAQLGGRFDEVESLIQELLTLQLRVEQPDAAEVFGLQLGRLRRLQGRAHELIEGLETLAEQSPSARAIHAWLALWRAEAGRVDEARRTFDSLAAAGFSDYPRDVTWMLSMTDLARLAVTLDDRERAGLLYEVLSPYGERVVLVGGVYCEGAVARFLGMLARGLGRYEEGAAHFERAIELDERLGAPPFVAEDRLEYGLLERAAGRGERAAELIGSAEAEAERLGVRWVTQRAAAAREAAAARG